MILTDQNFNEMLSSHKLLLVDFWAEWCGPCKIMNPILKEFSNDNHIWVGKLNVDENPEKSQEYSIQSIPTMVLFESGIEVKRIVGAMPKHRLEKELSQWI